MSCCIRSIIQNPHIASCCIRPVVRMGSIPPHVGECVKISTGSRAWRFAAFFAYLYVKFVFTNQVKNLYQVNKRKLFYACPNLRIFTLHIDVIPIFHTNVERGSAHAPKAHRRTSGTIVGARFTTLQVGAGNWVSISYPVGRNGLLLPVVLGIVSNKGENFYSVCAS